jgi:hypothetical protein
MKCLCRFGLLWAILFTFYVVSINGCGDDLPKRVPVSGHVFFDGQPLETGTLTFQTPGQRIAYALLGTGGKFTVTTFTENDGIIPGKHKVAVISKEVINANTQKWFVPKKYSETSTSGLEIDVTGPNNDIKFDLKSEPGQKYPFVEKLK